jgi:hypothetical protein
MDDDCWSDAIKVCSRFAKETNLTEDEVEEIIHKIREKESLKQSLEEMKLIRQGKMTERNLDNFLKQLEKEIHNE